MTHFALSVVLTSVVLAGVEPIAAPAQVKPDYAHPEMLVSAAWLEEHLAVTRIQVVDMRGSQAFAAGHIPGAVQIAESPLRNPEDRLTYLPRPEVVAKVMGEAGIGISTHVVAYDDQGGKMAARLWYILNAFGHKNVSLLNGGWNKWRAEGRASSTDQPSVKTSTFSVKHVPDLTCPLTSLLERKPGVVVLDVRSPDEYEGQTISPGAKVAGRIPGAVNVEWKENVAGPNLEFKSAEELRKMYAAKGITQEKRIITHCASGGRAAQTLFTLKLLGYPNVKVYYGSFADYSGLDNAPVEKP